MHQGASLAAGVGSVGVDASDAGDGGAGMGSASMVFCGASLAAGAGLRFGG